jgi:hypothetical protein
LGHLDEVALIFERDEFADASALRRCVDHCSTSRP